MKTNLKLKAEVSNRLSVNSKYESIKLGIDWHAREYRVVRMIEDAGPEPSQRFTPQKFLAWVSKQLATANRVYTCYEAGAGGFVLHRQLTALGATDYVIAPRDLDREHKGVQNDAIDARELALSLDRFVRGNPKAMRLVHVPTPAQEQRRQLSRQRLQLRAHRLSLAAQGRSLLLAQGHLESNNWWKPGRWEKLRGELPPWIIESLEIQRRLIVCVVDEMKPLRQKLEKAAPAKRPNGMGALTFEELDREVCDWGRFKNRKAPGSYAGLVGGVSASGEACYDLSITKAGNARLRTILIELAWRWVFYQSQTPLIQRWPALLNPHAHRRARKRAIVAVARQLLVELWRWRTGRATPEELGWVMHKESPSSIASAASAP